MQTTRYGLNVTLDVPSDVAVARTTDALNRRAFS